MEPTFLLNARNELTEHLVYKKLALGEKSPENRAALERLSDQEKTHYEFWKSLMPDGNANIKINPRWYTLWMITFLRFIFGVTFITKFLELHEKDAVEKYQGLMSSIPEDHKKRFAEIIEDEKSHERTFIDQLKEKRVSYIGFIVLGLADRSWRLRASMRDSWESPVPRSSRASPALL